MKRRSLLGLVAAFALAGCSSNTEQTIEVSGLLARNADDTAHTLDIEIVVDDELTFEESVRLDAAVYDGDRLVDDSTKKWRGVGSESERYILRTRIDESGWSETDLAEAGFSCVNVDIDIRLGGEERVLYYHCESG
ncbi:lipoprotein [Haloprofundus marisrubri]|uniref:lipoprotein n=1 Tax=Haloprofundus marisrubri TaxID=1514971 RepID=UPI0012BAE76E|nr:lipoprotein [Haloprofundus marisrubri]